MKNGGSYQKVLLAAQSNRRGMPPHFAAIEEKTEPWMDYFITSYFELASERPASFGGLMPIPWSKIRTYAESQGWRGELLSMFHRIVRAMDDHTVAVLNDRGKNGNSGPIRKEDAPIGATGRGKHT